MFDGGVGGFWVPKDTLGFGRFGEMAKKGEVLNPFFKTKHLSVLMN